jgi:thiol-disulfide isomerase/thioredoxin
MHDRATNDWPMNAEYLRSKFAAGLDWQTYLATDAVKAQPWQRVYGEVALSSAQQALIASFQRAINVLVTSGIWCGDCSAQCPMLQRIAEANPGRIQLRFVDRDEHQDLSGQIRINGGLRVPTAIFMAEDFEFVALLGDRTLSRYRAVAARQLGPSCPVPGAAVPQEELAATLQDWVNEFERVHLLLRLSARLREKHRD